MLAFEGAVVGVDLVALAQVDGLIQRSVLPGDVEVPDLDHPPDGRKFVVRRDRDVAHRPAGERDLDAALRVDARDDARARRPELAFELRASAGRTPRRPRGLQILEDRALLVRLLQVAVEGTLVRLAEGRWSREHVARKRHVLTIFRKELGFVMVWT